MCKSALRLFQSVLLKPPDCSFLGIKQQDQNLLFSQQYSNISQPVSCQTILSHFRMFLFFFYLFMFGNYAFCWTPCSKLILPLGTVKSWSWAISHPLSAEFIKLADSASTVISVFDRNCISHFQNALHANCPALIFPFILQMNCMWTVKTVSGRLLFSLSVYLVACSLLTFQ